MVWLPPAATWVHGAIDVTSTEPDTAATVPDAAWVAITLSVPIARPLTMPALVTCTTVEPPDLVDQVRPVSALVVPSV